MNTTKTCTKCDETKPLDEFGKDKRHKDGKQSHCNECHNKYSKKYYKEHSKEIAVYKKKYQQENIDKIRQKRGSISMSNNKLCSSYLGVVIAERLLRHLFNNVEVMPYGNTGYDFICNKGMKIDVKSGCITFSDKNKKYPRWLFIINHNTTADFFILVAFDNRIDLNPLHLWMIPGKEINMYSGESISSSTIHKWDKYKKDIIDAQICCNEMKAEERSKEI